jgi:hypothetical protein
MCITIDFDKAYYIKLGSEGQWEKSSIDENKIRIGWAGQSLKDINVRDWNRIREKLEEEISDKGAVTRDLNALKKIVLSTPNDIWVTFYSSHLYWCRVDNNDVKEDSTSKYRTLSKEWSCLDISSNPLIISNVSGKLSKTQGFRGTVCDIAETAYLKRLINNQPSKEFININNNKKELLKNISEAIHLLHWSDFETMVDILFTRAGWQRISSVGKTQKYIDMEYREPVTEKLYQVQVKSSSDLQQFNDYASRFNKGRFEKLYYIVHTPHKSLISRSSTNPNIELLLSTKLAEMIIDLGILGWLMGKIK